LQISNVCIIVADGGRGRLFSVVEDASGPDGVGLVERESLVNPDYRAHGADSPGRTKSEQVTNRQAGDVHPIDARRDQHRLELERRFAREIAQRVAQFTKAWAHGSVVLVAEPRLLGLLREPLHRALHPAVELKELAKDYSRLTASELRDHLALNRMIPARRH
jgi:protein required for attachment to host cells